MVQRRAPAALSLVLHAARIYLYSAGPEASPELSSRRLADHTHAAAVPARVSRSCRSRAGVSGSGQDRNCRRAAGHEGHRRPFDHRQHKPGCHSAAGASGRIWRATLVDDRLHRTAGIPVRESDSARGPDDRAQDVSPSACAVAALPPRPAHGRAYARHRTRHARHIVADRIHAVLHPADSDRDHTGVGDSDRALRRLVHRHHACSTRAVHLLHRDDNRVENQFPSADERGRFQGQHPGDRQPAQLRNSQVFQQRGIRGEPLRRKPASLGNGSGQEPDLVVAAQHRSKRDRRHRSDFDHVAGDARRDRPHDDPGRPGPRQRFHDSALHSAQFPGRDLSRNQASPRRYGDACFN